MIRISKEETNIDNKNEEEEKAKVDNLKKLAESLKLPELSGLLPVINMVSQLPKIPLPDLVLPEISLASSNFRSSNLVLFEALSERLDIIEAKVDYIIEIFKILNSPDTYK